MTIPRFARFLFTVAIICSPAISVAKDDLFPPTDYLRFKLQENDIVFLGTTHKKPEILGFIAELIPTLEKYGVSYVGLEIPSDQQEKIDVFMKTGEGLDEIKLHTQIDSPEYRHLFQVFLNSDGPIPVAIDLPNSMYNGTVSRDEWMARSLLIVLNRNPSAKILVIVGNLHTLKNWNGKKTFPINICRYGNTLNGIGLLRGCGQSVR